MARLQDAVRRVITAAAIGSRAADLGRAFDLDAALAWQIHALTARPDHLISARLVPKPGAMGRFLRGAARVVSQDLAREAETAYGAFEQAVIELAGDRDTFDAISAAMHPGDQTALRRIRRAAHRGNAAAWGVMSQCTVHLTVWHQRPTAELDCLTVLGYVGLRRLNADVVMGLLASTHVSLQGAGPPERPAAICTLIEEFCSKPLPRVERVVAPDGSFEEFLETDGLGKACETRVFWRTEMIGIKGASPEPPHGSSTTCRVPSEMMISDLLIPRAWGCIGPVRAWLTSDTSHFGAREAIRRYRLPFEGEGRHLGTSLSVLYSRAVPQYADVVRSEIRRMSWSDDEFDIFRCEVRYPLLHSATHLGVG